VEEQVFGHAARSVRADDGGAERERGEDEGADGGEEDNEGGGGDEAPSTSRSEKARPQATSGCASAGRST
jgi:hypothetical protein